MIAALLAALVIAQGGAEELWERYPLRPAPRPTAAPSEAPQASRAALVDERAADDGGMGTLEIVMLVVFAATGGAAALRLAQLTVRRRDGAAPPVTRSAMAPAREAMPPTEPSRTDQPAFDSTSQDPEAVPGTHAVRRFVPTPSPSEWERCRVRLWRGYVSRCYLAQVEGEQTPIARSPTFRQAPGPEATAALEALVEELRDNGWEPVLDADGAWVDELRRPAATRAQR